MDRLWIRDKITEHKGYKIALFTTFNFDISFFESAILNKLYENDIRKVSVFADLNEFNKALSELKGGLTELNLGRKYVVSPVYLNGSFHPKMVLLLGDKKARLIVASSNITVSGYTLNNEVLNVIDYSEKQPEYRDLIVAAIDYFVKINGISYGLDAKLIKECRELPYYGRCKSNDERFLVCNIDEPILDSVRNYLPEGVRGIKIAVPYYDNKVLALKEMQTLFPDAEISLYIQQGTSTFPPEYKKDYNILIFESFLDDDKSSKSNFYHGKVILFQCDKNDYILYGSANCTKSALLKTYSNGGNVECCFLDKGERGEFDYFFENLKISEDKELKSTTSEYHTLSSSPFRFISATTTKNGIICKIEGNIEAESFKYCGCILSYTRTGNEYMVGIDKEIAADIQPIFNMIIDADTTYELKCWVIDSFSIEHNREEKSDTSIPDTIDFDGDKYAEDIINYLKAEFMDPETLMKYKKTTACWEQSQAMDEESEETDSEGGFIVNIDINYDYMVASRKYKQVEKLRGLFFRRMFHPFSFFDGEDSTGTQRTESETTGIEEKKSRKATTEEKRFESFLKRRIKGVLDERYINIDSTAHYMGLISVIMSIFDKYIDQENIEDIFESNYVIETNVALLRALLKKYESGKDDGILSEKQIKALVISTIIWNRILIETRYDGSKEQSLNKSIKQLYFEFDKLFNVRDRIVDEVLDAADKNNNFFYRRYEKYGIKNAIKYLDGLYGYLSDDKFDELVRKTYGEDSQLSVKGKFCEIDAFVDSISASDKPSDVIVREINRYRLNKDSKIKELVINLFNKDAVKPDSIDTLKFKVSLEYKRWNSVISYKDGSKKIVAEQQLWRG